VEVLWPMDCAVDGGEGQPGPELVPGGSCGIHSWIEGASGDRRGVSWFAPQNQGGGRRLKMPNRGGTGIGLGTDGGDGHRRCLRPRCGRGGDGRRAASRAVRRLRQERRLGPRRGGVNLPPHEVLAVFSKPATYSGFTDPPKTANQIFIDMAASQRRLRVEERTSSVGWVQCIFSGFAHTGFLVSS
jgi:hypothetical protein